MQELSMRAIGCIGITLAFCLLALPAQAADVVRFYKVQHRTAEELLPLARSAMASEGSVEADPGSNSLLLAGSREGVAATLLLLSRVDRPLRVVLLRYQSQRLRELESQGIAVDWSGDAGAVRVGDVRWPRDGVAVRVGEDAGSRESAFAGEVRILEGQSASILTGQSLPVTTGRIRQGGTNFAVHPSTTFVPVESGFEAQARVLGDGRIQIELRPLDSQLRAAGRVEYSSAATTVVLEPGRTVALAGLSRAADAGSASFAARAGSSQRGDESLLLLTAKVE
jgi:type II secretory pathway component GspD/PulD (secretin)